MLPRKARGIDVSDMGDLSEEMRITMRARTSPATTLAAGVNIGQRANPHSPCDITRQQIRVAPTAGFKLPCKHEYDT